jgi:hypothetical protein
MKSKQVSTVALLAILPFLPGCAAPKANGTMPQALYTPGVGYGPKVYSPPPPPMIHFWAPGGSAAIQAGLMNGLGRGR